MELIVQVAYTKARLKSVLPTEKKKKKESQVSIIYIVFLRLASVKKIMIFYIS